MDSSSLYEVIISEKLTVEGLIRDIITSEGMDPWDIDISALVHKYLEALRQIKEMDLRISGKFLLAAAILLKMKSDYLLRKKQEEVQKEEKEKIPHGNYELRPHVPIPKHRKVTVEELISSLQSALVVKQRRTFKHKQREVKMKLNLKPIDLGEKIAVLYTRLMDFFSRFKTKEVTFSNIIPSREREDILWTFIPMIHLANKGKIRIRQEQQFGEIYVSQ